MAHIHILLVEDDDMTRFVLARVLETAGYMVLETGHGAFALQLLEQHTFDVVVTDIRMPEIDGITVLNAARNRNDAPEVILLTGYASVNTAVAALRGEAFNYLLKPCDTTELLACVADALKSKQAARRQREAMRIIAEEYTQMVDTGTKQIPSTIRSDDRPSVSPGSQASLDVGALHLDLKSYTATFENQPLHLTPTEFTILCCLAETPGYVLTAAEIVRRTHGHETENTEARELLHAHMRNLRRKIPPAYLVTVRGFGYRLEAPTRPSQQFDSDQ